MTKLVFVVPCHGRHGIASACLRQLGRTIDDLGDGGIDAAAVLVSDEKFFRVTACELGMGHVEAVNEPLGRKWNDGIEFACREMEADYVVPFGSDDVVDAALIGTTIPAPDRIRCSRDCALVSEDGDRIADLHITYPGGDGIRTIPRQMLERLGFRPAGETKSRAIDGSMSVRLRQAGIERYVYHDLHPLQIVDFKSHGTQRNSYEYCQDFVVRERPDPFGLLSDHYPVEFVDEIAAVYGRATVAA